MSQTYRAAARNALPDLCYVVRPGDENEELRYSLRSVAANLPHRRVWIAGHRPPWVSDEVGWLPVEQPEPKDELTKYRNARLNWQAVADCADIGPDIVMMNDDFFVTAPLSSVPVLNYGTIDDFMAFFRRYSRTVSTYMIGEQRTIEWLQTERRIARPLSYALHVPLPVPRAALAETLAVLPLVAPSGRPLPLHLRTALGNIAKLRGTKAPDPKVLRKDAHRTTVPTPFVSTSDRTWLMGTGTTLRRMFPVPSPYEITS
jgi:hypothetical protein